jgi:hypothetical protein
VKDGGGVPPRGRQKQVRQADGALQAHGKATNGSLSIYPVQDKSKETGEVVRIRWKATWVDHAGKLRAVSAATKTAAAARRNAAIEADTSQAGSSFTSSITVAELAGWWKSSPVTAFERRRSVGTATARSGSRRPGDVEVKQLRSEQVAAWQSRLLDDLSGSTVADTRTTLRQIPRAAVDHELGVDRRRPSRPPSPRHPR